MRLRTLKKEDAPFMLEWMHDESVVKDLATDFSEKTLQNCEDFIEASQDITHDMHMAIVENDVYMGTVSLKHITEKDAEFAVTIRKVAMGRGISKFGMAEIIKIGFENLKLKKIYWCVNPMNQRAIRFYDKNEYHRVNVIESGLVNRITEIGSYNKEKIESLIWYEVENE